MKHRHRHSWLARLALPAVVVALTAVTLAGPASAAPGAPARATPVTESRQFHLMIGAAPAAAIIPRYEQGFSSHIRCAEWSGTISWGGAGNPFNPAYIQVDGTIKSTCNNSWANLHLHYDTIDNPKDPQVGRTVYNGASGPTAYSATDALNTYKDIYVLLCSRSNHQYHCGNKKGPGA